MTRRLHFMTWSPKKEGLLIHRPEWLIVSTEEG